MKDSNVSSTKFSSAHDVLYDEVAKILEANAIFIIEHLVQGVAIMTIGKARKLFGEKNPKSLVAAAMRK